MVFKATADDAFGHLADQVVAIRETGARHPFTVAVAASRIKRHLIEQSPAISAHDMVAEEFNRLRDLPEFNLDDYSSGDSNYAQRLTDRVIEATRIPVAAVAVLAFWGIAKLKSGGPQTFSAWRASLRVVGLPGSSTCHWWLLRCCSMLAVSQLSALSDTNV